MKLDFNPTKKGILRWFLTFGVIFCVGLFLKFVVEPNLVGGDLSSFQTVGWILFGSGLAGLVVGLIFVILYVTII